MLAEKLDTLQKQNEKLTAENEQFLNVVSEL